MRIDALLDREVRGPGYSALSRAVHQCEVGTPLFSWKDQADRNLITGLNVEWDGIRCQAAAAPTSIGGSSGATVAVRPRRRSTLRLSAARSPLAPAVKATRARDP